MQASAFASDIDAYLAYLDLERGLARNTREGYQRDLEQCAAFVASRGARDWRRVTAEQAGEWVRSLSRRTAASSQARKLTALRMFARFLVRERLREDDFTALLRGPRPARRLPDALTGAEVGRLLASPSGGDPASLRDRAILELFYSSGLRVSELAALTLQQVDLKGGLARVFGKGSKERVVPVGARAREALGDWIASGRPHYVKARTRSELFLSSRGACSFPSVPLGHRQEAREAGRDQEGRQAPPPAPFLRHAPAHGRGGPAGHPGDARPREHIDDADLHGGRGQEAPRPAREVSSAKPGEMTRFSGQKP